MSMTRIASVASAAILLGTFAFAGGASAMPLAPLQPAAQAAQVGPENVAWVCGPYRCFWRPGYAYGYRPFYGPRFGFYGPRPWRYGWYGPRRHYW